MIEFLIRRAGYAGLALLAGLLLLVALRPMVRHYSVPAEFYFAPDDASLIVFIPDPENLLRQAHPHLCPFIGDAVDACPDRATEEPVEGPISEFFYDLIDYSEDSISVFEWLAWMDSIGLDASKPVLFAMRGPLSAGEYTLIASKAQDATACDRMTEYLQGDDLEFDYEDSVLGVCDVDQSAEWNARADDLMEGRSLFVKHLRQDRVALFTDATDFAQRQSHANSAASLFAQDQFSNALREVTKDGESQLWMFARQPGLSIAAKSAISVSFSSPAEPFELTPDQSANVDTAFEVAMENATTRFAAPDLSQGRNRVRITGWLAPNTLYSRTSDDLLNQPVTGGMAFGDLGYGAGATLATENIMRDVRFFEHGLSESLSQRLFTGPNAVFPEMMKYGSILRALQQVDSITAMDVQLAGFQDRVPDLALRFVMDEADAADVVRTIQTEEQISRDMAILAGAAPDRDILSWVPDCENDDTSTALRASVLALASDGALDLASTPGAFSHLWCEDLSAAFTQPTFTGCIDETAACSDHDIYRYLQPRLNDDDVRYRINPAFEREDVEGDPDVARRALVEEDRFRLVSLYDDRTRQLWIASELDILRRARAQEGRLEPVHERLAINLAPDRLKTLFASQAYQESREDSLDMLARLFSELSVYEEITLEIAPLDKRKGTRFDVVLSR